MKKISILLITLITSLILVGCRTNKDVELNSLSLNVETLELKVGETFQLAVTKDPIDIDVKLDWSSTNNAIASVSTNGLITANSKGLATIKVEAANDIYASVVINVAEEASDDGELISLILSDETIELDVNQTHQLAVIKNPVNSKTTLTWSSSNNNIATVSNTGLVKGVAKGEATIRVEAANGIYTSVVVIVNSSEELVTGLKYKYNYNQTLTNDLELTNLDGLITEVFIKETEVALSSAFYNETAILYDYLKDLTDDVELLVYTNNNLIHVVKIRLVDHNNPYMIIDNAIFNKESDAEFIFDLNGGTFKSVRGQDIKEDDYSVINNKLAINKEFINPLFEGTKRTTLILSTEFNKVEDGKTNSYIVIITITKTD